MPRRPIAPPPTQPAAGLLRPDPRHRTAPPCRCPATPGSAPSCRLPIRTASSACCARRLCSPLGTSAAAGHAPAHSCSPADVTPTRPPPSPPRSPLSPALIPYRVRRMD
ncbi:hypothetical protein PVAP13_2NG013250 [Panicum virgatum]|uniref:Uncharacterized protein n=1 Tax=Panicum virgatum TaxID=38727 RepID=A0A8T0VDD0_PANVG|nr:hypothetical protein PVAP13_2NG013250 [Panicum virgatum]